MAAWHRSRLADLALRASGLFLCSAAGAAFVYLAALHVPAWSAGLRVYGLAAIGFLCGSAGSALTALGNHLFDEMEVGIRWQHRHG
jgi:hypothetical protein